MLAAPDLTGVLAWSRSDAHRSSPSTTFRLRRARLTSLSAFSLAAPDLSNGNAMLKPTRRSAPAECAKCLAQFEIERNSSEGAEGPRLIADPDRPIRSTRALSDRIVRSDCHAAIAAE